jgi:hypothetical protein
VGLCSARRAVGHQAQGTSFHGKGLRADPNTTRAPFRKIVRDISEDARDYACSLEGTPEFEQPRNERKKVNMRFAHLKIQP